MASALALLAACGGPDLPESVVDGSEVSVGWRGTLTGTNTAVAAAATPGNRDIAALTRSRFGEVVEGKVAFDESFGTVEITGEEPFTVRYDLAEPAWSDGIPLDATDLLLAWAAGSDADGGFDAVASGLAQSDRLVEFEESDRALEVSFAAPVEDWATALDVAVPAHVVGQVALGVEDPMEAKKAVADAIRDGDEAALAKIAETWNNEFTVAVDETEPHALLSSGPYRITDVGLRDTGALRVDLVVNNEYVGDRAPAYEHIELLEMTDIEQVEGFDESLDVIQVPVGVADREEVTAFERRDYTTSTSHDGTMWVLVLRSDTAPFGRKEARAAFLRAVPRDAIIDAGGGAWADAYTASNAVTFAPGDEGYDIALEDSGFEARLSKADDENVERTAAGIAPGTQVCLAYERTTPFVPAAFSVLRDTMTAAGWALTDCGVRELPDLSAAPKGWNAALIEVPMPRSSADLARLWAGDPTTNLPRLASPPRDALVAKIATAVDPYDARDLRVQFETSLVDDAVATPVAMNPWLTLAVPDVDGVAGRPGAVAPLTSGIADWAVAQE